MLLLIRNPVILLLGQLTLVRQYESQRKPARKEI
jgi:hypothetical protein